jgi:hypothetical protein
MRDELERRDVGYVLSVACDHQILRAGTKARADAVAADLPTSAWHRYSAVLAALATPTTNRSIIALTMPGIRRLLGALTTHPARTTTRILHWSRWRRHHQQLAGNATTGEDSLPLTRDHKVSLEY